MERLSPGELDHARPLFAAMDHYLAVAASLAGETPAEIFVDRRMDPSSAVLLPSNRHRIYVAGAGVDTTFAKALAVWLRQRYWPSSPGASPFDAVIYHAPDAWGPALAPLLADVTVPSQPASRRYLVLRPVSPNVAGSPERLLAAGCVVRRIDRALCEDEALTNRDGLLDEILSESHSIEDFLRNKFGYCARCGDELAGWCLSEYNHGRRCEVGVETMPRFRRQGMALATVPATIAYAFSQGITEIGWHCWSANAPSISLAARLGFEQVAEYPVLFCRFGEEAEA